MLVGLLLEGSVAGRIGLHLLLDHDGRALGFISGRLYLLHLGKHLVLNARGLNGDRVEVHFRDLVGRLGTNRR